MWYGFCKFQSYRSPNTFCELLSTEDYCSHAEIRVAHHLRTVSVDVDLVKTVWLPDSGCLLDVFALLNSGILSLTHMPSTSKGVVDHEATTSEPYFISVDLLTIWPPFYQNIINGICA